MRVRVTGRVQGVGFRWWVRRQAEALHLTGWVINGENERHLEVVAEGDSSSLDDLERRLGHGPSGARVESVAARREPASGEFVAFEIVRS